MGILLRIARHDAVIVIGVDTERRKVSFLSKTAE
jgi:hypothetical protein